MRANGLMKMCSVKRCRNTDIYFIYQEKEVCERCVNKYVDEDFNKLHKKLFISAPPSKSYERSPHQLAILELCPEKWSRENEEGLRTTNPFSKKSSRKEHSENIRKKNLRSNK